MVLVEPHHALRAHTHLTQHNSDKRAAGFPIFKGGRRRRRGGGVAIDGLEHTLYYPTKTLFFAETGRDSGILYPFPHGEHHSSLLASPTPRKTQRTAFSFVAIKVQNFVVSLCRAEHTKTVPTCPVQTLLFLFLFSPLPIFMIPALVFSLPLWKVVTQTNHWVR